MEKKLQDLIDEKFEYESPGLLISEDTIVFQVLEEERHQGSFTLRAGDGRPVRGMIACSNPRMKVEPEVFHDTLVKVTYTYIAEGQKEGNPDRGRFVITSSCGEYILPFMAEPLRHYFRSSIGEIRTLNDFSNLARLNWEEALGIFQNRFFPNLFADTRTALLYQGICYRGASAADLEEFLIAAGKKSRIQLTLDAGSIDLGRVKNIRVESIGIACSGWGYLDVKLDADAAFLQLKQDRLTSEDFADRHAEVVYMVKPDGMHSGKNYGRIRISSPIGEWCVEICAQRAPEPGESDASEGERYREQAHFLLEHAYMKYRLEGSTVREWAKTSIDILDRLIERTPQEPLYFLAKCHVLIASENPVDAEWILRDTAAKCRKKYTSRRCYLHYLEGFLHKDTDRAALRQEIAESRRRDPDNRLLLWLENEQILQDAQQNPELLDGYYANIKQELSRGSSSPLLFIDAFFVLRERQQMAQTMDEEDQRILFWAAKHNLLTKKTASFIVSSAGKIKYYSDRFYRLLGCCYRVLKSDVCVRAVCTWLIKNNQYGEKYLVWFSRGLERRMRIAGLCEAYIQSWHRRDGDIPWKVLQYFSKRTALPSVYRARIYAYAVRNRTRIGKEWHSYERLIGDFVLDELKKDHMSDELAELCRYVREHDETRAESPEITAAAGYYKVACTNTAVSTVVVCEAGREKGDTAQLVQGAAFVRIADSTSAVLLEDSYGRRYSLTDECRISRLFPELLEGGENQPEASGETPKNQPEASDATPDNQPKAAGGTPDNQPEASDGNPGNQPETAGMDMKNQSDNAGRNQEMSPADADPDAETGHGLKEEEADSLSRAESIDELDRSICLLELEGAEVSEKKAQLLARMLFTGHFTENHAAYFRAVCAREGAGKIRDAYISYFSWRYFYADEAVPEEIFTCPDAGLKQKAGRCREAALLKYYCKNGWESREQEEFVQNRLEKNLAEGVVYPFFEDLPVGWRRRYLLHDIRFLFVSYLPGKRMKCEMIFESRGHENRKECTMKEVYPGLYTAQVHLFAAEKLEYMMYEMQEGVVKTGSLRLSVQEIITAPPSRHQALNDALEEAAECTEKLNRYAQMSDLTRILFQPVREN